MSKVDGFSDAFVDSVSSAIQEMLMHEKTRVISTDGYEKMLKAARILSKVTDNPDDVKIVVGDLGSAVDLYLTTKPFEVYGELLDDWRELLSLCSAFDMMASDNGLVSMDFTINKVLYEI